eukprot:CAMPEP_0118960182 /NCGR_PEP_ID=MMETSP1169-20130426/63511_1 /TAXON_ID=36882 /ORGANISM="Pyramimonas obovata, Strain CCMP722" /LENGTH=43 /DNA_ID= /DNA_START= /DNA_END= /DNA_ORIENTATION=
MVGTGTHSSGGTPPMMGCLSHNAAAASGPSAPPAAGSKAAWAR